ncbi:MAG: ATP-binding protein [Petrimonas sp.]|nr:ATP-binding protein [Petrimonas sp.]
MKPINPFITSGYISSEYFCDREIETGQLLTELINGNDVALISTRRMGKTGLIKHVFNDQRISKAYYTFFIDIYATKSLREFIFALSKEIVDGLKPFGRKAYETFVSTVKSLQAGISFDVSGIPNFHLSLSDIQNEKATLDEIFHFIEKAEKRCIIAIDEFQQIASYPDKNIEAILRTHVQHCNNGRFIFAGSQRHIMGNMFLSASRPFYQSVSMMQLGPISMEYYIAFAQEHFDKSDKTITREAIISIYNQFEGITWYVQKLLNTLFSNTPKGGTCSENMIAPAIDQIINSFRYVYAEAMFRLPEKQKELLIAIAKAGKAERLKSAEFISKYKLSSASSVQSAQRVLLEKDYITGENDVFGIYDRFFGMWIAENW